MRLTSLLAAVSLGLALTACGSKTTTTTNTDATDVNATADAGNMAADTTAAAAALPAQGFTDMVAGSDMFEIQSGKLARTMGASAAVKDMGKMLVTDHTKSSSMLKSAAAKTSSVVAIPVALPADLKAKVDALKATKGADFDKLFVQQQVEGHQKALDALNAYSTGGDQPSLKDFATTAIPVVQGHLTKLQAMPQ